MSNRRTFMIALGAGVLVSCHPPPPDVKAAARRFYEALNRALATGDMALLDDVLAPDAIDRDPIPGQEPGRDGIKKTFAASRASFSRTSFAVEDLFAEGDKVALRIVIRMTHSGDFEGIPASGKRVSVRGVDILRIRDGKVAERWGQFDSQGLMRQLAEK